MASEAFFTVFIAAKCAASVREGTCFAIMIKIVGGACPPLAPGSSPDPIRRWYRFLGLLVSIWGNDWGGVTRRFVSLQGVGKYWVWLLLWRNQAAGCCRHVIQSYSLLIHWS